MGSLGAFMQLTCAEETRHESFRHKSDMATVGAEEPRPVPQQRQAGVENTPPPPLPPPLTCASGRGFPETQLGGAQRTAVRAAPDAPEERERRELEASTCSEPRVHDTSKQTRVHARAHIHALFCNRGRGTAAAE